MFCCLISIQALWAMRENQGNVMPVINQNLYVGFMELADEPLVDPSLQDRAKKIYNADTIRLWARHFSPDGSTNATVTIPSKWMMFFTNLLLSPTHYAMAKSFLTSQAWQTFRKQSISAGMTYVLPQKCPTKEGPTCSFSLTELTDIPDEDTTMEEGNADDPEEGTEEVMGTPDQQDKPPAVTSESTSAMHKYRKRQRQGPMLDSDCRRSERVKELNKGFKRSVCPHKDCFACASAPPTISSKVIRELGSEFCKVKPEALIDAVWDPRRQ